MLAAAPWQGWAAGSCLSGPHCSVGRLQTIICQFHTPCVVRGPQRSALEGTPYNAPLRGMLCARAALTGCAAPQSDRLPSTAAPPAGVISGNTSSWNSCSWGADAAVHNVTGTRPMGHLSEASGYCPVTHNQTASCTRQARVCAWTRSRASGAWGSPFRVCE